MSKPATIQPASVIDAETASFILALPKAVKTAESDAARAFLPAGKYSVDQVVRIKGEISISEDTEKVSTVSIPVKDVLALFIARAGITRERSVELLREAITLAMEQGKATSGAVEAMTTIDSEFNEAVAKLSASLPKTKVRGAVRANVTWTPVA